MQSSRGLTPEVWQQCWVEAHLGCGDWWGAIFGVCIVVCLVHVLQGHLRSFTCSSVRLGMLSGLLEAPLDPRLAANFFLSFHVSVLLQIACCLVRWTCLMAIIWVLQTLLMLHFACWLAGGLCSLLEEHEFLLHLTHFALTKLYICRTTIGMLITWLLIMHS